MRAPDTIEITDFLGNVYPVSHKERVIYLPFDYIINTLPKEVRDLLNEGYNVRLEIV